MSAARREETVTKIYEHIKSRRFLEQLCLECIQDVKQKPTYLNLKQMVDRLLCKTVTNVSSCSPNDAERITNMRMQVAECGMLAYTIDCVVAEVVCNKIEKEFTTMVKGIVEEILHKPDSDDANAVTSSNALGVKDENTAEDESPSKKNLSSSQRMLGSSSPKKCKQRSPAKKQAGQSKGQAAQSSPGQKNQGIGKKDVCSPNHLVEIVSPGSATGQDRQIMMPIQGEVSLACVPGTSRSDGECELMGDVSVGSVSPVHTSDLSSFDDFISLSEGEDGQSDRKTKIRLREANHIFLDGKLHELYLNKKHVRPKRAPRKQSSPTKSKVPAAETSSSSEDEEVRQTTPRKTLPRRQRKPNSKYASEIYKCSLKTYGSSGADATPFNPDPAAEDIHSIQMYALNGSPEKMDTKCSKNVAKNGESSVRKRGRPKKSLDTNELKESSDGSTKRVKPTTPLKMAIDTAAREKSGKLTPEVSKQRPVASLNCRGNRAVTFYSSNP